MEKKKCKYCKHEWNSRVEDPLECPNCKRRDWEKIKEDDKRTQTKKGK